jgi:Domain of unknown function (DUF6134)
MTFARFATLAAIAMALGPLAPKAWAADEGGVFTFTVTRDDAPIGTNRVAFKNDGERTELDSEMELKVSFAMVPLYHFKNRRHEIWQDDRPLMINSKTDDNGEKLDITLRPDGAGYVRTVNDRVDKLDPSTNILAIWNQSTVEDKSGLFASVIEDEVLRLAFDLVGQETMKIDGRPMTVDHYRMTGQEERDIWYDPAGQVARVRFVRDGSVIEYIRNEYEARPLDGRLAKN